MTRRSDNVRRPKVAMLADYPHVRGQVDGGVQAASYYLVEALAETGAVALDVISYSSHHSTPTIERLDGYTVYRLPRARLGTLTRWSQDTTRLRSLLGQLEPDVVHAQGALADGYMAVSAAWPSIVTFHGINRIDARYQSRLRQGLRLAMISRITENFCARNADHVIVNNPYVEETYGSALIAKTHYIPNPTHSGFFRSDCKPAPGRILFAGRLIRLKGVKTLIEAFSQLRRHVDTELRLAGSLDDQKYVQGLLRLATELGVSDRVKFLGLLSEHALIEEFRSADVLVLPSFQENSPMVIQQAMACGMPVVATRVGGIPHIVSDGRSGLLVQAGDPIGVADAILKIISSRSLRESMSRCAREGAIAFRSDGVAKRTIDVYRAVIAEQRAATDPNG